MRARVGGDEHAPSSPLWFCRRKRSALLPAEGSRGSCCAAAETGSGKTGAFALPVLQIVHEAIVEEAKAAAAGRAPPSVTAGAPAVRMSVDDRDPLLAVSADGLVCQVRRCCSLGKRRGAVAWSPCS